MASLWDRIRGRDGSRLLPSRQAVQLVSMWRDGTEKLPVEFADYVHRAYLGNGVVFATVLGRLMLFTEATPIWRNRRTHEREWSDELAVFDRPWPGGTFGDLLARMEQDISMAGNSYTRRVGGMFQRLRPDWVSVVTVPEPDGTDTLVGYVYETGGFGSGGEQHLFGPGEVAHYAAIPDPLSNRVGVSWLTSVAREILADTSMSRHKLKFFENAATPNLVVKYTHQLDEDTRIRLREELARKFENVDNAYRSMVLDSGADIQVIGKDLQQLSFANTQAGGENRIVIASGVPSIVVGIRDGLNAATYSNYGQAMRKFADMWARPSWRFAFGALATLAPTRPGWELWYDDRDIPALQQDAKDAAEITQIKATTMANLVRAGYELADIGPAVETGDLSALGHTGKIPVTLYPEGLDPRNQGRPPEDT